MDKSGSKAAPKPSAKSASLPAPAATKESDAAHFGRSKDDGDLGMPMWKSYLYHLQQQAPQPKRIVCQRDVPNKPPFYGREYHGAISREDADFLLTIGGEGSYLIRESQRAPGQYTLAIRFEGVTKNFKLYYDGQHYVGEKRFDTVQDLVADGLITFYLEAKAADYIAALSSQSNYAESPYVAYNTQKKRQMGGHRSATRRTKGRDEERKQLRRSKEGKGQEGKGQPSKGQEPKGQEPKPKDAKGQEPKASTSAENGTDEPDDPEHDYVNQPAVPPRPKTSEGGAPAGAPPKPAPRLSLQQQQLQQQQLQQQQQKEQQQREEQRLKEQREKEQRPTRAQPKEEPLPPPPQPPPQQQPPPQAPPSGGAIPASIPSIPDEVMPRVTSATNTDGPRSAKVHSIASDPRCASPRTQILDARQRHSCKMLEEYSFATPPGSPPPYLHNFDADRAQNFKASSVMWCTDYLEVMGCEKPHNFKLHTFKGPHWCDYCANFLWGLIAQGVKCQDCGFNAHKKCSEKVPSDCMPDMKYVKRMFGVDLTTLVKAQNTLIPAVVEMCVKEIEKRGLEAEGLYRVAGFHDDVEAIKILFDKDGELTDITEDRYEDLNTITSVLKLYFRLLPIPLVTFDIYFKVMDIVRREDLSQEAKLNALQHSLAQLPPAHFHTLKYLMAHLHRVTEHQQQNMMNAENLAIVFSPTLLRSPETDPLTSLTAVKYERELIELLIAHHAILFD